MSVTIDGTNGIDSPDLNITGTGARITGDFSNATIANRVMFQSSTTNGNTNLTLIPNGTAVGSQFWAAGGSDIANSPYLGMVQVGTTDSRIQSGIQGTASYTPMTFYTGGSERMRVDTSGNVGIGTSSPSDKLTVISAGTQVGSTNFRNIARIGLATNDASVLLGYDISAGSGIVASTNNFPLAFWTSSAGTYAERMRISSTGGLSVGTAADPGAGAIYATGSITAYYSDDHLKNRLGNIENALDKVCSLDGFYYEANETAQSLGYKVKREVGLSAQQVQAVLPEVVVPAPIDDKYLTLHYDRVIPLLVEAIKELRAEVATLKTQLKS